MTRRALFTSAAAGGALAACGASNRDSADAPPPETAKTHSWHLRYAPRIGWFGEDAPIPDQLEMFAAYGFRAFEYNSLHRNHTLDEAAEIRRKMDQLGLEMGVFVVNSGGWQGDALLDPKFHDSFLADVRKSLDYHKVMRNRWCTVTSGLTLDYLSPSRQTQNLIDGLKKAVEIIADSGLTLVLEPLNVIVDHPGYHVVTSEHAAQVIDGVGSEQVKILFDIYHQQISEGNLIHNIEKHWDRIGYFQIGDVPGRLEPGTGEIRYAAVFRRIYELGYEGILGMEHRLSGEGREGMDRCFEAYRQVDTW